MQERGISVPELFAKPEFGVRLTDLRHAIMVSVSRKESLARVLSEIYADPSISKYDLDDMVSYQLEISDESFSDLHGSNPELLELHKLNQESEDQRKAKKGELLTYCEEVGASPFVVHSLWLHNRKTDMATTTQLFASVQRGKDRFEWLDQLVSNNAGKILMAISGSIISAAKLAEGDISIEDHNRVLIPTVGDAYSMSMSRGIPQMFSDSKFALDACDIAALTPMREAEEVEPSELLAVESWFESLVFNGGLLSVGGPAEGPEFIPAGKDHDYFSLLAERIRLVGNSAVQGVKLETQPSIFDAKLKVTA